MAIMEGVDMCAKVPRGSYIIFNENGDELLRNEEAYTFAIKHKLWLAEEIQKESDECYNPSDDSAPRGYWKVQSIPQKMFDSFRG